MARTREGRGAAWMAGLLLGIVALVPGRAFGAEPAKPAAPAPPAEDAVLINGVEDDASIAKFSPTEGCTVELSDAWQTEGKKSLKVTVEGGKGYLMAINGKNGGALPGSPKKPLDWSPYKAFKFDVYNPGASAVELRIQVKSGDYRGVMPPVKLAAGAKQEAVCDLTKDAALKLESIGQVNFIPKGTGKVVLHFDNFRLVKK